MKQFSDQIFWITGASAGIGEAIAKEAASQGAKLVLSARRVDELERVAKECKLSDNQYLILPMDISQYKDFSTLVGIVIKKFGRIDYLFNNAGVSTRALASETPIEVDKRVMDINYFGSIALTKAVLPYMTQQKKGHIIVTSSVVGYFATPMRSAYAASKHALHGFYNALREEVHTDNIIITILCPGYIKTNISINALKADGEKFNKMSVNQSAGMDPNELAKRVLKSIKKNRRSINIGGSELFGIYLNRFAPGLLSKILRKKQSKNSFTQ
ncbi:MAG: SDR family oxidoreductase [Bacteroidales bacterium]|nr:SDR family oxidoreductase [Bacteroidales bacterium]